MPTLEPTPVVGVGHARAAIESGTDDATALALAAHVISLLGKDRELALIAIERALSLNASSAMAHIWAAHIRGLGGNPAAAPSMPTARCG